MLQQTKLPRSVTQSRKKTTSPTPLLNDNTHPCYLPRKYHIRPRWRVEYSTILNRIHHGRRKKPKSYDQVPNFKHALVQMSLWWA